MAVLAGCVSEPRVSPGRLDLSADWQNWMDDPYPHLVLTMSNRGGDDVHVGPGGAALTVEGPRGRVPVDWGDTPFSRPVPPHETIVVAFHPRVFDGGSFTLSIDHARGTPTGPPSGYYAACIAGACAGTVLK